MTAANSQPKRAKSVLSRLRTDVSGNVLAMVGASAIPLMAIVGGSIDAGRLYASKARLQQACDSAALAGRKSMTGFVWANEDKAIADGLFNNNFPTGKYGTNTQSIRYEVNSNGDVKGIATAKVPTTVMQMFGSDEETINVTCTAKLELPNSDVMFVVDTTGSMNEINSGDTVTRLTAAKTAITQFHTALEDAKTSASRIRYGFVPYSSNVNVGYFLNAGWMASNATYQSRVSDGTSVESGTGEVYTQTDWTSWVRQSGSSSSSETTYGAEICRNPSQAYTDNTITLSDNSYPYTGPPSGTRQVTEFQQTLNGTYYETWGSNGNCTRRTTIFNNLVQTRTRTRYPKQGSDWTATRRWWMYKPVSYDVSSMRGITTGGSIVAPIGNNHTNRTVTWQGCIEEAETVRAATYTPIPATAYDMQIDLVPTTATPATLWKPALPQLVYARTSVNDWSVPDVRAHNNYTNIGDDGRHNCPAKAKKLAEMTASDLSAYLATLTYGGNTYHDIGMVWGARFLSPTGIFASENSTAPNSNPIARHLIFMTDGETATDVRTYDSYGWPALDRRRQVLATTNPSSTTQTSQVEARLTALCESAKGKGMTVWVIAFGTTLSSLLSNCASTGKSFQANNAAQLNAAFSEIATAIAKLRLTE